MTTIGFMVNKMNRCIEQVECSVLEERSDAFAYFIKLQNPVFFLLLLS